MRVATSFIDTCREYGEKRLEIQAKVKSREDWIAMWYDPINPYVFEWGECWKGNIEYSVDDYAAEVGFWLDMVGLKTNAFGPEFSMVTSPDKQFFFSFVPAGSDGAT